MFFYKTITGLQATRRLNCIRNQYRNLQVSVIGAASQIGSNLVLILKRNPKITKLYLYDDDEKVKGVAMELAQITRGMQIIGFAGENFLPSAIRESDLILMVARASRKVGTPREKMLAANAPAVQRLCSVIADQNKDAFLAISTNPINSVIPFASSLLYSYGAYNPNKICGITHIDSARCRNYVGNALKVNPHCLQIPIIGGHSDETIIPLFSNLIPSSISVDSCTADTLTRLVRKAGTEVLNYKHGGESSVLSMAWSIAEFTDKMLQALCGYETMVNCFSANPYYGTRFFAGPAIVGPQGIIRVSGNLPMTDYESTLLAKSIPTLNKEVCLGENYINVMNSLGNLYK